MAISSNVHSNNWYVLPNNSSHDEVKSLAVNVDRIIIGFKSINWGRKGLMPGDNLYLIGGGVYRESLVFEGKGSYEKPIVVDCYGMGECIIDGDNVRDYGVISRNHGNVSIKNLNIKNHKKSGIRFLGCGSNITIRRNRITSNGLFGIYVNSESDECMTIHVRSNRVVDHNVAGIFISANQNGLVSSVYIEDNEVSHNYLTVNFGVRWATGIEIYPGFGGNILNARARDIRIINNQVHDNDGTGINIVKNTKNVVIEKNKVWSNGKKVPAAGIHVGGVLNEFPEKVAIRKNEIWDQTLHISDGSGILVDDYSRKIRVERNTAFENEEAGIKLHNTRNVDVDSNTTYKNEVGIKMASADSFRIINNLLRDQNIGIQIEDKEVKTAIINKNIIINVKTPFEIPKIPEYERFSVLDNCVLFQQKENFRNLNGNCDSYSR